MVITPGTIHLIAEISRLVALHSLPEDDPRVLRLRKISQIQSIHGTLAIEGNTMSIEQITAVLEGRKVIAPEREIREVKNAFKVYEQLDQWKPVQETHLLRAHSVMMGALLKNPGRYRDTDVGVMAGSRVVHMGSLAKFVPQNMGNLFTWLRETDHHPLIASSVFHYEFEFIHPFEDGNGRMGRLWQTLILNSWEKLFSRIPVESMVFNRQQEYYDAIAKSNLDGHSGFFTEFILSLIRDTLAGKTPQATPQATPQVKEFVLAISGEMTRNEIQEKLNLRDSKNFREAYLIPALQQNIVEMTLPETPNSPLQKYRLTTHGQALKEILIKD